MNDPQLAILLVEDSPTLMALAQRLLGNLPARLLTAINGLAV